MEQASHIQRHTVFRPGKVQAGRTRALGEGVRLEARVPSGGQPCRPTMHLRVAMKIPKLRFWIEMLVFASAIACVLALFLATLGAAAAGAGGKDSESGQPQSSAVPPPVQPQSYEGIITDTHCGAKHSAAVGLGAGDCTRVCVHGGEHFALVDGDKAYTLEGEPGALKRVAGQRVKILGTLSGTTISVASVTSTAS